MSVVDRSGSKDGCIRTSLSAQLYLTNQFKNKPLHLRLWESGSSVYFSLEKHFFLYTPVDFSPLTRRLSPSSSAATSRRRTQLKLNDFGS